jgi:hypothetical protein
MLVIVRLVSAELHSVPTKIVSSKNKFNKRIAKSFSKEAPLPHESFRMELVSR